MEHFKSRSNDFFHFTNPHDNISDLDDDAYDELQYYDYDEDDDGDDDRSCDFNFHTYRPLGINGSPPANSQTNGANGALMFQLENTMKNISDRILHTIEGIDAQISHIEDETCKLDYHVEDVKNIEERFHEMTHRKLRQMQSILQEVQDGVLYLRDKHDIADMQLQLAILRGSKREKIYIPRRSSCSTPILNQQTDLQFPHFIQSQLSNMPLTQISNPRNYKSEFHAKYMPESASYPNIHLHRKLPSSHEISNMKPVESFLHPQEESSGSDYIHTHVAQTPLHALPAAIDVNKESRSETSETNRNTVQVTSDVVDRVAEMGFRRDLVRGCVRELTVNASPVDLNSVLDKMMKNN